MRDDRRPFGRWVWVSLFALAAGCGGRSHGEEHGAAGVGGGATAGGSSTSGGATSSSCPGAQPSPGTTCNYAGPPCNYAIDHCSSVAFDCQGGLWTQAPQNDGAAYTCSSFGPGAIPADGSSCDCFGELDCTIDDCTEEGKVHAVCDNSTWQVTSAPCTDRACGSEDLRCKTNELCVAPKGLGGVYSCQANPCAELLETTSCACAGSLCGASRCVLTGDNLDCVCDTC